MLKKISGNLFSTNLGGNGFRTCSCGMGCSNLCYYSHVNRSTETGWVKADMAG